MARLWTVDVRRALPRRYICVTRLGCLLYCPFPIRGRPMPMSRSRSLRVSAALAFVAVCAGVGGPPPAVVLAQGDANQVVPLDAYQDLKWRSVGADARRARHRVLPACASSRTRSTSAASAAACGRPTTPASPGRRSATARSRDRIDRLDRRRAVESESRLGRHRQRGDSLERDHRPRRLQVDRRRQELGSSWASRNPGRSAASRCIRPTPTRVARRARLAVRPERRARHLQDHRRRQDVEEDAVRRTTRPAAATSKSTGRTRHPLRGDVPRLPQGLGHHQRRPGGRRRHLQVDRRRRDLEEASPPACRQR